MSLRLANRIGSSALVATIALSWSCIASATLGQPEASIAAETQASKATIKQSSIGSYRIHEMDSASGTVIREYVGLDGKVFAVTWRGPFAPNMRDVLGQYLDEYSAAAPSGRMDRNHVLVKTDDLVVRASGHMRAYRGIAYLPQAMPVGVSIGDLQ